MTIPPQFLDELRARLSLSTLIGRRVRLMRRGREHTGLCPFHNEKTPSFTVNDEKGFFHCFGCGAHGDVVGFEMRVNHLSFPEAVERLATEAGIAPPAESREEKERARRQASLHDVMEAACAWFETQLRQPGGRTALAYLHGRGLDDDTIARFRLGFSPDARTALATILQAQGIGRELAIEAGLLIQPDRGEPYDRFRGRVLFPISDRRGRIIAFGGRIMGDGQPKYLNSPDTPLFQKGSVLYGLAHARATASADATLAVVEGYMDVIAMIRAGLPAVAPLGTALTERQIEELWRLVPEPVLCFDGDAAGQRAAAKAAERVLPLLRAGHSLRFALLPPSEDPDSLIARRGAPAMAGLLASAQPLADILWRQGLAGARIDTPERRAALERRFEETAQAIAERSVQQHYRSLFRQRLWEIFRSGRSRPGPAGGRAASGRAPTTPPVIRESLPADRLREAILLAVVINHPRLLEQVAERLGSLRFSDKDLDNLRQEVLKHLDRCAGLDSVVLQRYLDASGFAGSLASLLGPSTYVHAPFAREATADDMALHGWEHTYNLYLHKELKADIDKAELRLATEMSDESYCFFRALKTQEQDEEPGGGEAVG